MIKANPKKTMKNYYFFIILLSSIAINAQSRCEDANYYVVSAYSHVKKAYDATNLSHLQYSANRSVESMKLSIEHLKACGCLQAIALTNKAVDILVKADEVEVYEDGRFFVKRGREATRLILDEVEKCDTYTDEDVAQAIASSENNEDALSALEEEQKRLEAQQKALVEKQASLKAQLKQQEAEKVKLAKMSLIKKYQGSIAANLKTYNATLKSCGCNASLTDTSSTVSTDVTENSIKTHYLDALSNLASNYVAKLNSCKN